MSNQTKSRNPLLIGLTMTLAIPFHLLLSDPAQASHNQMFNRLESDFCLNAHSPGKASKVNLWKCDKDDPDQRWERIPLNPVNNTQWMIRRVGPDDLCLNAHSPRNGSTVNLWKCDAKDPDQRWEDKGFGEVNKQSLQRVGPGDLCLNAHSPRNGSTVNLWKCSDDDSDQFWKNESLSDDSLIPQGNISLPYNAGQTWYVCQGYNGPISHKGYPALDLTVAQDFGRNNSCWAADGNVSKSAGQAVLAPADGTISHVNTDLVCLSIDDKRSLLIGHMNRSVNQGQRVSRGTVLGTVSSAINADGSVNKANGGYSHIHLEARKSKNCQRGTAVPLTAKEGFQLKGVGDLPLGPTHWKRALTRP